MDSFIEELLSFNANYDAQLLEKAYRKADELHKEQKRKSGEPYIIHPKAVAVILAELGMDDRTIASGLLHDTLEDTVYGYEDIKNDFGEEIAMLVDGVTKLTNINYASKEEAQAENIRKMFLAMSKDIRVLVIKLADRLHNIRTINYMTPAKIEEKCRETLEIYAPLAARLGIYAFKFELEDVSFKNLEPEAWKKIDDVMLKREKSKTESIEYVISEIRKLTNGFDMECEIYGRSKHYYSIYKKMTLQNKQLEEIFDLSAIRVITDSIKDCYAVLGAVHTRWTPIPGKFKDYVAMPKPNGYQSLHTTVISDHGNPFEIQIRTKEMHRVAEYGVAAHWKYKEGIKEETDEEKLAWIRQTLEWQQDLDDPREFVETLKMDLFSSQVFVFSPKGDVMELPAGSTPLDFAFKVHTAVGSKCIGAKVNGKMVPIDYTLQNGEIVEIVTSNSSKGPSADWLKIVKTNSAKNKIKQYLKRENKPENVEKGKDLLEKTAKRKNLDAQLILKSSYIARAVRDLGFQSPEELYSNVSNGGAVLNKVLVLCTSYLVEDKEIEAAKLEKAEEKRRESAKKKVSKTKGVTVKGVENLYIHFAKCCNPVPGDDIIGFTTKGRGVSIHRRDCVNLQALSEADKARLIEVAWDVSDTKMSFEASINLIAEDRKGLVSDVSKTCEELDIGILGIQSKIERSGITSMILILSLSNTGDIVKVLNKLGQIKGVLDVYRTNS